MRAAAWWWPQVCTTGVCGDRACTRGVARHGGCWVHPLLALQRLARCTPPLLHGRKEHGGRISLFGPRYHAQLAHGVCFTGWDFHYTVQGVFFRTKSVKIRIIKKIEMVSNQSRCATQWGAGGREGLRLWTATRQLGQCDPHFFFIWFGFKLSDKPYLIWGVIQLFVHVFSRPEGFCLTRAILAHFKIISCHTKHRE